MIISPSGRLGLELRSEVESREGRDVEYLRPVIVEVDGGEVFRAPDRIAGWFRHAAAWDEHDRAWISSADSGTTVLLRSADGSWSRAAWDPDVAAETIWDASTGEDLPVLRDPPPPGIARGPGEGPSRPARARPRGRTRRRRARGGARHPRHTRRPRGGARPAAGRSRGS